MLSAHDVARELRSRLPGAGDVKIHKLLYYCQAWHIVRTGEPLFREKVEAWANGPVVASLWRDERRERPTPERLPIQGRALDTVAYVTSRYGRFTGRQLIDLTHAEDPWLEASRRSDPNEWANAEITPTALERFFSRDDDDVPSHELLTAAMNDHHAVAVLRGIIEDMHTREPVEDDFTTVDFGNAVG